MDKKLWVLGGLVLVLADCGTGGPASDAAAVLQASQKAMGDPNTIQYSGTGMSARFAVAYAAGGEWPRRELSKYTRAINYAQRSSREDWTFVSDAEPWVNGIYNQQVNGDKAWLVNKDGSFNPIGSPGAPQIRGADARQLQIWLTPHGFLKAALAAGNATLSEKGDTKVVSFTALGKYPVHGTIDANNLVTNVETTVGNSGASSPGGPQGDMALVASYSGYRDFSGIKFPTAIQILQGGYPMWELDITNVTPNEPFDLPVPEAVKSATVPANWYGDVPVSVKVADGVWFVKGGNTAHNQVLVEFADYVAVTEAPLRDERTVAMIAEAKRLVPNKPLRYVLLTGHYLDHTGGLRAYVSQGGATIVTHAYNLRYFEKALVAPATIDPDMQAKKPGKPVLYGVSDKEKYVLSDGKQTIEMYATTGDLHLNERMLMYLPGPRILVADELPPPQGMVLYQEIQRLKLNVATILPVHGPDPVSIEELKKMIAPKSKTS